MNIQEYISSGIIENYVLGATSPEENEEIEKLAQQYPEIQSEIEANQLALGEYVMQFKQNPPFELRGKILEQIAQLEEETVQEDAKKNEEQVDKSRSLWIPWFRENQYQPYLVAASITLVISVVANIFLYFKWLETKQELYIAQHENTIIAQELENYKTTQDILMDRANRLTELKGSEEFPQGLVAVYWNQRTNNVYLQVKDLPDPPAGKQYQLWSVHNGKVDDAGMIELDQAIDDIQKMKNVAQVDAFVITLEKKGGVPVAEGKIYAQGQLLKLEENI